MKVFLVDVHNAIEMSHYETFFYKNIKQGNISVFEKSLNSLKDLGSVLDWITEDINRNPFSIDHALVVFFLPRKLAAQRIPEDYEIFSQMYINELLERHLDDRFKYLCFYLDETEQDRNNDILYQEINEVNAEFSTDNVLLNDSLPPRSMPTEDSKESTISLISRMQDDVAVSFYSRVLSLLNNTELDSDDSNNMDWYRSMFLRECCESVSGIKTFQCPYFSDDIAQKIEIVLKVVKYICHFVDNFDSEKDFDLQLTSFMNKDNFSEFKVDMSAIRKEIVTYKKRLSEWQPPDDYHGKTTIETVVYNGGDHSKEFEEKVKSVSTDGLRSALNPPYDELSEFDLQENVFSSLDKLIQDLDTILKAFCNERIAEMHQFFRNNPVPIERANETRLPEEDIQKEYDTANQMNRYNAAEIPGYPAELKLRQELELLGRKIKRIGGYMKAMKPIAFVFSLLFALASIGIYYFGLQNSIFAKEKTLYVFCMYIAVFAIMFAFAYVMVRVYYKRRIRTYLKHCLDLVMDYLHNYIVRAEEFERNLNSAMNYYCSVDENNKMIGIRFEHTDYEKRKQWHCLKIKEILGNLSFFDAFIQNTRPVQENGVPELKMFEDDAAHSEFYQMRIFN